MNYDVERRMVNILMGCKIRNLSNCRDVSGEACTGAIEVNRRNGCFGASAGGRKTSQSGFLQVDTTNILFICGGAFDGLERIILQKFAKDWY